MGYGNVAPAPLICTVWALASVAAARRARVARILFISFFPSEVDQHLQTVAGVVRPGGREVVGLERVVVGHHRGGDALEVRDPIGDADDVALRLLARGR